MPTRNDLPARDAARIASANQDALRALSDELKACRARVAARREEATGTSAESRILARFDGIDVSLHRLVVELADVAQSEKGTQA